MGWGHRGGDELLGVPASRSPITAPHPLLSPQALLESLEEDLAALLSGIEGGDTPPLPQESWSRFLRTRQRPLHAAAGPPMPPTDPAWLHFFNDFVTTHKKFRGRTKKMAQQGCFGMKLDRIGTLSGLGC